jgi:hypothetical protein
VVRAVTVSTTIAVPWQLCVYCTRLQHLEFRIDRGWPPLQPRFYPVCCQASGYLLILGHKAAKGPVCVVTLPLLLPSLIRRSWCPRSCAPEPVSVLAAPGVNQVRGGPIHDCTCRHRCQQFVDDSLPLLPPWQLGQQALDQLQTEGHDALQGVTRRSDEVMLPLNTDTVLAGCTMVTAAQHLAPTIHDGCMGHRGYNHHAPQSLTKLVLQVWAPGKAPDKQHLCTLCHCVTVTIGRSTTHMQVRRISCSTISDHGTLLYHAD